MATFINYSKQDVAAFTGRPVASFPAFVDNSAIPQALLLFKLATCLTEFPDNPVDAELARNAILAMADAVHLAQPYQTALASPFSSESIGSYSYSKAASAVSKGDKTGVMWFDMAIERLGVCDLEDHVPMGGGIEIFEHDIAFVAGSMALNNSRVLSPQDMNLSRAFGFDPAPRGGAYRG